MPVPTPDPRQMAPVYTNLNGTLRLDAATVGFSGPVAVSASTKGPFDPTILPGTGTTTDPLTGVVATGARPGAPGLWVPTGALVPLNLGAAPALTATPTWASGQYINIRTGAQIYWNGTAWIAGAAP
jgi:hypothetical protein